MFTVPADVLLMEIFTVSSTSGVVSTLGVTVKVSDSPTVPTKVKVCPVTAV